MRGGGETVEGVLCHRLRNAMNVNEKAYGFAFRFICLKRQNKRHISDFNYHYSPPLSLFPPSDIFVVVVGLALVLYVPMEVN